MKEYLFEINPQIFNYEELLNNFKTNNTKKDLENIFNKQYIWIYKSKIILIFTKITTNNFNFVKSISKVLSNDEIDKKIIKRKDNKTKFLLKILKMKILMIICNGYLMKFLRDI